MRRYVATVAAGLLAVAALAACEEEEPVKEEVIRPVRAMQVTAGEGFQNTWLPGVAKATQETDLSFEVEGKLTERPVNIGDRVETGQTLARLDPRNYENEMATAVAESQRAKSYLDRIAQAVRSGAVAKQDLTDAQARYDQAEAQVKIRQKAVDDTILKAPFPGTVSFTYKENFDNVQAKEPVIRLVDTSRIEFVVNIPESIIGQVRTARNARVKFDQYPDIVIPAEIKEIATEPSEATRTYPVSLIMDQPAGITVLPGMAGRATGEDENQAPVGIVVPVSAVFSGEDPATTFVWVIDDATKTVGRRQVETGELVDNGQPVTEGLEAGEWIATAGVHYLKEGQKVRLLTEAGAAK